jgi:predicted amino acid-binding ACT domain protein
MLGSLARAGGALQRHRQLGPRLGLAHRHAAPRSPLSVRGPSWRCAGRHGKQLRWMSAAAAAAAPMERNMLFKVTGSDTLGVVAKFSRVLADHGAQIMDVDQSACTIHSTFTLDLLARCPAGDVIQDMLTTAKDMEVNLEVVALEASTMRSDGSPGMRYKLTLFNRGLSFESLAQVSEAAAQAGLSIERLDRLTPLDVPVAARPPTALRIVLEEGGTPGGESTSDISEFVQALRFVQDDLDCHLLLEGPSTT